MLAYATNLVYNNLKLLMQLIVSREFPQVIIFRLCMMEVKMNEEYSSVNKQVSVIYRTSQIFFDQVLSPYHIGSGQQFFLLRIMDQPGINLFELAEKGHYDKGTTTRAVKKLEEEKYIFRITDEKDRRISRLYVTEEGKQVIKQTERALEQWQNILTNGMAPEEQREAEKWFSKMAENAHIYIRKCRKKENKWNREQR